MAAAIKDPEAKEVKKSPSVKSFSPSISSTDNFITLNIVSTLLEPEEAAEIAKILRKNKIKNLKVIDAIMLADDFNTIMSALKENHSLENIVFFTTTPAESKALKAALNTNYAILNLGTDYGDKCYDINLLLYRNRLIYLIWNTLAQNYAKLPPLCPSAQKTLESFEKYYQVHHAKEYNSRPLEALETDEITQVADGFIAKYFIPAALPPTTLDEKNITFRNILVWNLLTQRFNQLKPKHLAPKKQEEIAGKFGIYYLNTFHYQNCNHRPLEALSANEISKVAEGFIEERFKLTAQSFANFRQQQNSDESVVAAAPAAAAAGAAAAAATSTMAAAAAPSAAATILAPVPTQLAAQAAAEEDTAETKTALPEIPEENADQDDSEVPPLGRKLSSPDFRMALFNQEEADAAAAAASDQEQDDIDKQGGDDLPRPS